MQTVAKLLEIFIVLGLPGSAVAQIKVIRVAQLWDGARVLTDVFVVIDGDRIARVSNSSEAIPGTAEVIDLRKYTLLPGLIDLHTHLTYMFGQNTRELGWFVKAGMSAEQALATATTTAAELLGMQNRLGRIAPGYAADFVAVEGDPLQAIDALFTGVRVVIKDGRIVVDKR